MKFRKSYPYLKDWKVVSSEWLYPYFDESLTMDEGGVPQGKPSILSDAGISQFTTSSPHCRATLLGTQMLCIYHFPLFFCQVTFSSLTCLLLGFWYLSRRGSHLSEPMEWFFKFCLALDTNVVNLLFVFTQPQSKHTSLEKAALPLPFPHFHSVPSPAQRLQCLCLA